MARLRFGLLTTFYPPFNFGGDGIDVQRTAHALVARGHHVTVVHEADAYEWLSGKKLDSQPVDQRGVEVIALRSKLGVVSPFLTHQFGRPIVHGRALSKVLSDRAIDVVVFNNVSLVGGPGLLDLGGNALKVYVAHEHWLVCPTHVLWRYNREACDRRDCVKCVLSYRRPPQLWRFTKALERRLPQVDLFIARSEFSRAKHHEFGFSQPMEVMPYFLAGEFPPAPELRLSPRPHDRPYFLFVGRLTRIKGLHTVIPAFARYPDADLLIVGDGEEDAALREQAKGIPNVKFAGRVANEQLGRYYEHAVAALAPSTGFETFGIVLIEAFRYQTPVIARRIGPFPEIIETARGGMLFSNEEELLAAITRLHRDPVHRDALASNAYEACRTRWSESVVIDRFLDLVTRARAAR